MAVIDRNYAPFTAEEMDEFDRDFSDITKMYSSQEQDNLIQIWTGTEFAAAEIQAAIVRLAPDVTPPAEDQALMGTDKGQAVLHLGFFKDLQGGKTYTGRSPEGQGIGMDVIRTDDVFGTGSNFTLWDQPTAGWTAMPAAQRQIRGWCELVNPDVSAMAAVAEINTIDINDDHWALLIFGVMELSASADIYAFHWQSNRQPRAPYVLENQIRVGDIALARFGPIYIDKTVPFAFGLEFRGDAADVPNVVPKLWGLTFFTIRRALQEPRLRPRAA